MEVQAVQAARVELAQRAALVVPARWARREPLGHLALGVQLAGSARRGPMEPLAPTVALARTVLREHLALPGSLELQAGLVQREPLARAAE